MDANWRLLFNLTLLDLEQAANVPIDRKVQEFPPLADGKIEWVPLDERPVPDARPEVGNTPPTSAVRHEASDVSPPVPAVVIRHAIPAEAAPVPFPLPVASVSMNVSAGLPSVSFPTIT